MAWAKGQRGWLSAVPPETNRLAGSEGRTKSHSPKISSDSWNNHIRLDFVKDAKLEKSLPSA